MQQVKKQTVNSLMDTGALKHPLPVNRKCFCTYDNFGLACLTNILHGSKDRAIIVVTAVISLF